jgi:hypothetical protein
MSDIDINIPRFRPEGAPLTGQSTMIRHDGWQLARPAKPRADRYRAGEKSPAVWPPAVADEDEDKARPLAAALRSYLFQVDDEGTTPADRLAKALTARAIGGDKEATAEVFNRCDGAPVSRQETAGAIPLQQSTEMPERVANRVLNAFFDIPDDLPRD